MSHPRAVATQFALLLLIAGAAISGSAQESGLILRRGDYRNADYAYEVRLPAAMAYEMGVAPNPNHGFQIRLGPGETVWVDASYTDSLTLRGAAATEQASRPDCEETHRTNATLGVLPALELTYSCAPRTGEGQRIERVLVALRSPPRRATIQYIVGLRGPPSVHSRADSAFGAVARGFRTMTAR